jgi:hypothetical protein
MLKTEHLSPAIEAPSLAPSLAPAAGRFRAEVVERPAHEWDALAAGFGDMCMEQTMAFMGARWSKLHPLGLVLREEGPAEPVAMALVLLATLPVIGAGMAYVKFGPLWRRAGAAADPRILLAMLEALKAEFSGKRRLLLRILPPADPGYEEIWRDALARAGFVLHAQAPDRERYLVDLTLSEPEQLASLGASWRAHLKKASRDLEIEELLLGSGIPVFLSLYRGMLARKRFDDRHGIDDLPKLAVQAGGALGMRLFIASHHGAPVVGSIVIGSGERVFVPFSATSDAALSLRAGYALRWAILGRLRMSGARWLDLGGAEGDAGLRSYKLGNVGKRGRVAEIPGEFDFAPNSLSAAAARAIEIGRDLVRTPALKKIVAYLPI